MFRYFINELMWISPKQNNIQIYPILPMKLAVRSELYNYTAFSIMSREASPVHPPNYPPNYPLNYPQNSTTPSVRSMSLYYL